MSNQFYSEIDQASKFLLQKNPFQDFPKLAVVLGSGFKEFISQVEIHEEVPFSAIPFFSRTSVAGHGSSLCFGRIGTRDLVLLTGRIHLYEGHSTFAVVHYVRSLGLCGVENLLLTNAAGGLQTHLKPGDVLVLKDHINGTGLNCLIGSPSELGSRFVDMSNCYDRDWRKRIIDQTRCREGVYIGLLGPNYETHAETALLQKQGIDAVGMSTVLETIAARQMGLKVACLSFITNLAAGLSSEVSHEEVIAIGKAQAGKLSTILKAAIDTAAE